MGRNAKRRKEVKKMKRAEKGIVELNVKEIREKAIKHNKIQCWVTNWKCSCWQLDC